MKNVKEAELPLKFWMDHKNRGCSESAVELKRNKMYVTVALDVDSFQDIISDSYFYAFQKWEDGEDEMKQLQASARATYLRLQKVAN